MSGVSPIIDVVSDLVCPWCRIGKANLDQALAQWAVEQPQRPLQVRWWPFFLSADVPAAGVPYRAYMERKFGSAAAVEALFAKIVAAGAPTATTFHFERIARRPNTLLAHRLIDYVQTRDGDAHVLVGALFDAFFVTGEDIGDAAVLSAIAGRCGLSAAEAAAYLASDAGVVSVQSAAAAASGRGIGGVPYFRVAGQQDFPGAVPVATLLDALRRSQESAGPSQVFLTPLGGAAASGGWGRSVVAG